VPTDTEAGIESSEARDIAMLHSCSIPLGNFVKLEV
jgi:hypothetical protein